MDETRREETKVVEAETKVVETEKKNDDKVFTLEDYKNKLSDMEKVETQRNEALEVLGQYSAKLDDMKKEIETLKSENNKLKAANQQFALHSDAGVGATQNNTNFDSILLKEFAGVQ